MGTEISVRANEPKKKSNKKKEKKRKKKSKIFLLSKIKNDSSARVSSAGSAQELHHQSVAPQCKVVGKKCACSLAWCD
jgi:hypothetical protein